LNILRTENSTSFDNSTKENIMNLLKAIVKRHHASSRWAVLAGTVLWLSLAIAPTVQAAPINYTIDTGFFSGTFTLDTTIPLSFSIWSITPVAGPTYTQGSDPILFNFTDGSGVGKLGQSDGPGVFLFNAFPNLTYTALWQPDLALNNSVSGTGSYSEVGGAVPEPAVSILLAIGLLVLAGSRWLPGRRERQQLG
jgi:hypothetical protein